MVAINIPQKQSTNDVESGLPLQSQNESTSDYGSYGGPIREAQSPDTPSDHWKNPDEEKLCPNELQNILQFACIIIVAVVLILIIYASWNSGSGPSSSSPHGYGHHGGGFLLHHGASHGHHGGGHGHGHGGHHG